MSAEACGDGSARTKRPALRRSSPPSRRRSTRRGTPSAPAATMASTAPTVIADRTDLRPTLVRLPKVASTSWTVGSPRAFPARSGQSGVGSTAAVPSGPPASLSCATGRSPMCLRFVSPLAIVPDSERGTSTPVGPARSCAAAPGAVEGAPSASADGGSSWTPPAPLRRPPGEGPDERRRDRNHHGDHRDDHGTPGPNRWRPAREPAPRWWARRSWDQAARPRIARASADVAGLRP